MSKEKVYVTDDLYYIQTFGTEFKVKYVNKPKNTAANMYYTNGGFWATPIVPVGFLIADFVDSEQSSATKEKLDSYAKYGITYGGGKFYKRTIHAAIDGNVGKNGAALSTLFVQANGAVMMDKETSADFGQFAYAISGAPIMINGKAASWSVDFLPQGWGIDVVEPNWHIFLCTTNNAKEIIIVAMRTKDSNCILYDEAYKNLLLLNNGLRTITNAIMLDGGSPFIFQDGVVPTIITSPKDTMINNIILY